MSKKRTAFIGQDQLQDEVILIKHHVGDIREMLDAKKYKAMDGALNDIDESCDRLRKFLSSNQKREVDRATKKAARRSAFFGQDQLENEVIVIKHHVEDLREAIKDQDYDYMPGGLDDIEASCNRLQNLLSTPMKKNIDRTGSARTAAYEEDVNPAVRRFWTQAQQGRGHYQQHPFLNKYGNQLQQEAYAHTEERGTQKGLPRDAMQRVMNLFPVYQQIAAHEEAHKPQLEDLAKKVVSQIYGIAPDKMVARLKRLGEIGATVSKPERSFTPESEIQPEVNKRKTANMLTQGAAVHGFMTAHHLAEEALDKIDPELRNLYDQLSSISHQAYWVINPQQLQRQASPSGRTFLQRDNNGKIIVVAEAATFNVLIQELIKGVMELLSLHGMNKMDRATHQRVTEEADDPNQEPWKIQAGPALWRRIMQILPPRTNLGEFMRRLNQLPETSYHNFLTQVMEEPEKAKIRAKILMSEGGSVTSSRKDREMRRFERIARKIVAESRTAAQPWILWNRYEHALERLKNSRYFRGRPVNPADLNLSMGQLHEIFGTDLNQLMQLGIVAQRPRESNPFGGGTTSYTIVAPRNTP